MSEKIASPADVLAFWRDAGRDKWFKRDDAQPGRVRVHDRPSSWLE